MTTRRIRIVKYRGSVHGTDEYPFLIDEDGISVLPVTSMELRHTASDERVSTGIAAFDAMLSGGYYRGSTVLVSGTAGTGKTSLAAVFVDAACRRGERCLFFAFEESQAQAVRNMRSIDVDLEPWLNKNLLRFHATRPSGYGLEMHLATMHKLIEKFNPVVVVIDPISNMIQAGSLAGARVMLMRLIDFLKTRGITAVLTDLTSGANAEEQTEVGISSLVDTWILIRNFESGNERERAFNVLKSRGMSHSRHVHRLLMSSRGIEIIDTPGKSAAHLPDVRSKRSVRGVAVKKARMTARQHARPPRRSGGSR